VWTEFESALSSVGAKLATSGDSYEARTLDCTMVHLPGSSPTFECAIDYRAGSGDYTTVTLAPPSDAARLLLAAFVNAGAHPLNDPAHGGFLKAANVTLARDAVTFDDRSQYFPPPAPNASVTGDPAQAVLDAMVGAGIRDDQETGDLFIVCSTIQGAPSCGYDFIQPDYFGTSIGGGPVPASSAAPLWTALVSAATAAGIQPIDDGSGNPVNVVNARAFSFDGTTLRANLLTSTAVPPPPPPR
jgi:hypothetical protein